MGVGEGKLESALGRAGEGKVNITEAVSPMKPRVCSKCHKSFLYKRERLRLIGGMNNTDKAVTNAGKAPRKEQLFRTAVSLKTHGPVQKGEVVSVRWTFGYCGDWYFVKGNILMPGEWLTDFVL